MSVRRASGRGYALPLTFVIDADGRIVGSLQDE